jgi:hypothetical protein
MIGAEHFRREQERIKKDPFLKFFKPVRTPGGQLIYDRRIEVRPSETLQKAQQRAPKVTKEAADIYKAKTGKAYTGAVLKEPEPETLGKSESALSRRERLRRRRDAAFQFASMQKQGGKAQSGV